jgi:hypothetical protein
MEAVRASETSVNFNVTTLRYIPEDSKLETNVFVELRRFLDLAFSNCMHIGQLVLCSRVQAHKLPKSDFCLFLKCMSSLQETSFQFPEVTSAVRHDLRRSRT